MKLKAIATLGTLALLLQACATPHVVQTKKITDNELTCSQIKSEIAEAEGFEKKARAERKITGKNVAAAVFFWPALIGTYSNTEEAITAAKERQALLTDLYSKKNCQ